MRARGWPTECMRARVTTENTYPLTVLQSRHRPTHLWVVVGQPGSSVCVLPGALRHSCQQKHGVSRLHRAGPPPQHHEKEKFACLRARGVLAKCLRRACGVLACLRACLRPPGPHWPPAPPQSFKLLWAPVRGYDLILTVLGNDLNLTVLVFCVIWRAH